MAETVEVVWEGDSLDVIRRFPGPVKQDLGAELRKLQEGDRPLHSRPMPSIGVRVRD
jgi:phage-related protein